MFSKFRNFVCFPFHYAIIVYVVSNGGNVEASIRCNSYLLVSTTMGYRRLIGRLIIFPDIFNFTFLSAFDQFYYPSHFRRRRSSSNFHSVLVSVSLMLSKLRPNRDDWVSGPPHDHHQIMNTTDERSKLVRSRVKLFVTRRMIIGSSQQSSLGIFCLIALVFPKNLRTTVRTRR